MVKITEDMKETFLATRPYFLATCSDNVPNVAPMGMVILQDDMETIWIVDNYMSKTLKNLEKNAFASLVAWNPDKKDSYQFKCSVKIEKSGSDYEKAVEFAHSKSEKYPAKSLIKLKIEEVYYTTPGPQAGSKVL